MSSYTFTSWEINGKTYTAVISLVLIAVNIAVFAVSAAISAKILQKDVR